MYIHNENTFTTFIFRIDRFIEEPLTYCLKKFCSELNDTIRIAKLV